MLDQNPDRASVYAAKLDQLVHQAIALPESARQQVLSQLADAARAISADLSRVNTDTLSAARLRMLKTEVDRVMASFAAQATADVSKAQRTMYADAAGNVAATVNAALPGVAVHTVMDTKTLSIAQNYTADLITGLSSETASKINKALQRTALGGSPMSDLVKQIGGALSGGEFEGYFSETGARASSIAQNEILRVHSLSAFATLTDLAGRNDGIEKEWLHIPIAKAPRVSHELASGQTRPVDQPFSVGGEDLMYPRDPSGSAENTIFCHCLLRPKVKQHLLQSTDQDRALLKKHGVSITTSWS